MVAIIAILLMIGPRFLDRILQVLLSFLLILVVVAYFVDISFLWRRRKCA